MCVIENHYMKLHLFRHPLTLKYGIAIFFAALIALLFSYSNGFPYKYNLEETWNYDDLYTDTDIPLQFSKTEQDSILNQVERSYAPVFDMDIELLADKKVLYENDFKKQLNLVGRDNAFNDVNKSPKIYLQFGEKLLSKIYEQGILPNDAKLEGKKEIVIVRNGQSKVFPIQKIFTIKTAFDAITDSLPASSLREPEFLLSVLEDKIVPNLTFNEPLSSQSKSQQFQKYVQKRDTLKKGSLIIAKGAIISESNFQKIEAYKNYLLGGKTTMSTPLKFLFFWLFNSFLLVVLFTHFAKFQPDLLKDKDFLAYFFIILIAIQTFHFLLQNQSLNALFAPMLFFPILYGKRLNQYTNAITSTLMIFIASQVVNQAYPFVISFICASYFYIFAEKQFGKFKNGKILHIAASNIILVFTYCIIATQQNFPFDIKNVLLAFVIQVLILLSLNMFIKNDNTSSTI